MSGQATLTSVKTLVANGFLSEDTRSALADIEDTYAVAVPLQFASLIDKSDPDNPIARQVLPSPHELTVLPEELSDPIGDHAHSPVKGVVLRYPDRVLLKVHNACAVYCRFCFRREMVGPGGDNMSETELKDAYSYIAGEANIWEVILTGGDPMVLSVGRLKQIFDALEAIDHVSVVRVHTRVPVAAPERITQDLVDVLANRRTIVYVAVHANHALELTAEAGEACQHLVEAGIPLLGQTVLLKGVNDDVATLDSLFRKMVTNRITPYYLHHPDLAPGTSHFRVSLDRGQTLMKALRGRLSGIALPRYMLDIPGGYGKVPAEHNYVISQSDNTAIVEDVNGKFHVYPPMTPP